jgi:hypothetical protein
LIDHAEAGHAQAGVDAENSHEVPQMRLKPGACDTTTHTPRGGPHVAGQAE